MQDQLIEQATKLGTEHGAAAASWVFDGNTTDDTYRAVLAGLDDGDPAILDSYRTPDLSGEYADDYSESDLAADLTTGECREQGHDVTDHDGWDDAVNAYLDAASEAFWGEVERMARAHVEPVLTDGTLCGNCGRTATQAGCTVRTRVIDWRTDYLCDECVMSYDWTDWDYDGVATYTHKQSS